ncbi:carbohydrate ABC transporter permease [Mesorhizobium sp. NPDC059054]|uniref:carbohydrate ABC transporter permease n=1 Tax=Mesorhizobium sp. NPDC059054 TaxID=3346711 RepID=UPI00369AA492
MQAKSRLILFTLPALAVYLIFSIYPLLSALRYSLTDYSGVGAVNYIGLDNYRQIATDPNNLAILWKTLFYSFVVVVLQNLLGLAVAVLLFSVPAVRDLVRVIMLVPSMLSLVVAGFIWQYIYSPIGGGLNEILGMLALEGWQQVWLGDAKLALYSVAIVNIWMFAGYSAAIFLAGYGNIPKEIQEAAAIDGTGPWSRFFYIELPLLAPAFTVNITLSTIGSLKTFELPLILTNGGPDGASTTLGLAVFKALFNEYRFGFASAFSVVMLVLIAAIAFIQNRFFRAWENRI